MEEIERKILEEIKCKLESSFSILEAEMIEQIDSKPRFCGSYVSIEDALDSLKKSYNKFSKYIINTSGDQNG